MVSGKASRGQIALADAQGAADLLGDDDAPQIVDPSDDACRFHLIDLSLLTKFGIRSMRRERRNMRKKDGGAALSARALKNVSYPQNGRS